MDPATASDPSGLGPTFVWKRVGVGKRVGMTAKATSWKCIKLELDPAAMALDLVPGGGGVKAGIKGAQLVLGSCDATVVKTSYHCICDLKVTWTCSVKELEYRYRFLIPDVPTGRSRMGSYTYKDSQTTQDVAKCKVDNDCKGFCAKRAQDYPKDFASKLAKVVTGWGGTSTYKPGWKGWKCAK